MTRHLRFLALTGLLLFNPACSKNEKTPRPPSSSEPLILDYDKGAMERAVATARRRVGEFIEALARADAESYSVNVAITDINGTEQFWINTVTYRDGQFTGRIENDPEIVRNVKSGQSWSVSEEDISDWMFIVDGKIHGGFTIEPLLPTYPKEEADDIKAKLVR